ncbi:MAG: fibronectin type III domain-containing protein, partial [Robiginitomaculum sp.]|nr:fibronectin type III domain-containing protein [Robiginitomaculum sp.]
FESAISNLATATPITTPNAPTTLSATAISNEQINLSWTAPATGIEFGTLLGYLIERHSGDGTFVEIVDTTNEVDPTATTYSDTGLANGTTYTYRISAITTAGTGEASGSVSDTTFDVPNAPVLSVTADNNSATASWTAPADDGSVLTGYTLTITDTTDSTTTTLNPVASATQQEVVLINGHTYTFVLTATNGVGTSADSNVVTVSPLGAPDAIDDLTATAGDTQVFLDWTEPGLNGSGTIDFYTIHYDDVDGIPRTVTINHPSTTATITGLTNGHEYSFTITATNDNGSTSDASSPPVDVTPLGSSGTINDLAATAGDEQVFLDWTKPDLDGSGEISFYTVSYVDDAGVSQTTPVNAPDTSATITGLINGFEYTFRVTSTNQNGNTSGLSNPASATPLGAPEQITDLTAQISDKQVFLDWSQPDLDNSGDIVTYTITYDNAAGVEQTITVTAPTTEATISNLVNGHSYTFSVTATNGVPLTSIPATVTAIPLGAADTINDLGATVGDTEVTLNWTEPGLNDSGSVDFYTVSYTDDNGVLKTVQVLAPTTTLNIPGLTNGFTYTFTVTSTNDAGFESTASNPATATPITTPNAPTDLSATAISNEQINLSWTAPSLGAEFGTLLGYLIERHSGDGVFAEIADTTNEVDPTAVTYSDTGLSNGITYTYIVSAITTAGTGDASGSAADTTFDVPNAPVLSVTADNNSATASWTAPADNGSALTGYTLTITDNTAGTTTTLNPASSATQQEVVLVNGHAYDFILTATNGIGTSANSNPVNIIPFGAPDTIDDLTATSGDKQVTLNWTEPGLNGSGTINFYTVSYNDDNGILVEFDVDVPTTTTTITGLTNSHSYTFSVTATNFIPNTSTPATVTEIPYGAPDQISDLSATDGSGQVTLNWSAPGLNDSGNVVTYTITYDNDAGVEQTVTVNHPTTTATITGLTNGNQYLFTIVATNGIPLTSIPSTPIPAIPLGAPEPIDDLATTSGDGQVTLNWTEPELDNSGDVVTYTITYDSGSQTVIAPLTTATITGLTNGNSYTFSVTATNGVPLTSTPATITEIPLGAPEPIDDLAATIGDTEVILNWTEPELDNSGDIDFYTITYENSGTQTVIVQAPGNTNTLITGLTNGVEYTFTITATNVNSLTSTISNPATVTPAKTPNAPTGLSATAISNEQINLAWTAPSNDPEFGTLIGYQIERHAGDELFVVVTTTSTPATTYSDTGLDNGTTYTYRVSAVSSGGVGTASGSVADTTFDVPNVPVLSVTADNNSATASWTAPADNGSTLTGYTLTITDTTAGTTTTLNPASSATQQEVVLINGHTYTFVLTATNGVGTSANSNIVTVSPLGAPDAIDDLTTTPGDTQVFLDWTKPDLNGSGEIVTYTIHYDDVDGIPITVTINHPSTTATITGLTNGHEYSFTITATNDNGSTSIPSSPPVTATPLGSSGTINDLAATAGDEQIFLDWTKPDLDGSGDISFYTISYVDDTGVSRTSSVTAPDTSATIIGLTNGFEYTFRVTSTNQNGNTSGLSNPASETPLGAPEQITDLTAQISDKQVFLDWTEPELDNSGDVVTYTITYDDVNGLEQSTTVTAPTTEATITGLT